VIKLIHIHISKQLRREVANGYSFFGAAFYSLSLSLASTLG